MSLNSFAEISDIHIDVLKEIANIGSGNAASSLSRMIGHTVNISIPDISILGFNETAEALGGADAIMVGTLLMLVGDINGMMMFLMPVEIVCDLVNMLMFTDIKSHEEIDDMGYSVIHEVSNIMSASFITAIADMTDLKLDITPPEATLDMLGSILSVPSIFFAKLSDTLMLIQNELEIEGRKTRTSVLMLPDMPSLEKLMASLGIDI